MFGLRVWASSSSADRYKRLLPSRFVPAFNRPRNPAGLRGSYFQEEVVEAQWHIDEPRRSGAFARLRRMHKFQRRATLGRAGKRGKRLDRIRAARDRYAAPTLPLLTRSARQPDVHPN